jgi:chemotaxis protein CheD
LSAVVSCRSNVGSTYEVEPVNYFLKPGFIYVAAEPAVISTVLGSSVAVSLYDRKRRTGGMNHFRYPMATERGAATALYGNAAVLALLDMMISNGSKLKHLEAQIIGGAYNPELSSEDVGRHSIRVARRILGKRGVRVVSEDAGGSKGRKVVMNTSNGELVVVKVDRLRAGDWYPYEDQR